MLGLEDLAFENVVLDTGLVYKKDMKISHHDSHFQLTLRKKKTYYRAS